MNNPEGISQTNFKISKQKEVIFLCEIVNLRLERTEPHNKKLETGNGGREVFLFVCFYLEVKIRIDIYFWR